MEINNPVVLSEVHAAFGAYERALMSNDLGALDALFWASPQAVRYGPCECLYGQEEIAAFRRGRPGGSPQRTLTRTVITTFGSDFATANTEFVREDAAHIGRQSHAWARLPQGWRIVAAHVSMLGAGQ